MADEQVKSVDIGVTPVFGKLHDAFNFNYEKHHAKRIIVLEGSSGCFNPSQTIVTKDGVKPLSEIRNGEYVLSYNEKTQVEEYRVVEQHHVHANQKKCLRITLKNGSVIECTEDHKFYYGGNWIPIRQLLDMYYHKK